MGNLARRYFVSGMVQGVGFRYFTVRTAQSHGVVGYVRNLPDGRVEVLAEGEPLALSSFKKNLEQGPLYSRVTNIEELECLPAGRYTSFTVEY